MKRHSFKRLFLVYSAFYLLIICVMVGLASYYLFQSQKQDVVNKITKQRDKVASNLAAEVSHLEKGLKILKASFGVFEINSSKKSEKLFTNVISEVIQQRDVQYNGYFALDPAWSKKYFGRSGYTLVNHRDPQYYGTPYFYDPKTFSSEIFLDDRYQTNKEEIWYHSAKTSDKMVITEPYYDQTYMRQWLITASLGIYQDGKFQGMVGIDILIDELTRQMEEHSIGKTGGVLWFDKQSNQILSQSSDRLEKFIGLVDRFKSPSLMNAEEKKIWERIISSSSGIEDIMSFNDSRYVVSSADIPGTPWTIVVYQDYWEAFDPVFEKFYRICVVALFAILLLVQLSMHMHRTVAKPMENLIDSIRKAIRGARANKLVHRQAEISGSGYREMYRLSKMFNLLLRVIDRNTSKQFAAIELERVKALHQAKMASLGQMASGIAHEINNPLSILNGRLVKAEKYLRESPPNIESATSTVRSIEQIVFRIAKIVRGLRQFSREASKDPFELKSLREIIEETLDLCAQRFQNHGISVQTSELDQDVIIECQTVQISQVILNLLNNSFDAVMELSEKWIRIEVQDFEESVIIRVTDSGKGIGPDLRDRIMDPFFTTKEVGKGTGLGLSLSRGIIEYHQGQLFLDVEAENTSFVIRLPKFRNYKIRPIEKKFPDWK